MTAAPGVVVWFTGLPASGKTTLAERVRQQLSARAPCLLLDSDVVRDVLGADGYEAGDRDAFYRILAGLAGMLAHQGQIVLVAATAPRRAHRELARALAPRFLEVWVRTPRETCERRDVKGLYARARAGDAPRLPGMGAPYEPPLAPDVTADGGRDDAAIAALERLLADGIRDATLLTMPHRPIPRSYDEIARETVPNPDGSFRPTVEQEAEAIEHRHILEAERDLNARIKEALLLARDILMSGVFIEVDRDRVKLRGRVLDRRSLERVEEIVTGVEGVAHVNNLLVVGND